MSLTVLKYFLSGLDTNHPHVWLVIVLQAYVLERFKCGFSYYEVIMSVGQSKCREASSTFLQNDVPVNISLSCSFPAAVIAS